MVRIALAVSCGIALALMFAECGEASVTENGRVAVRTWYGFHGRTIVVACACSEQRPHATTVVYVLRPKGDDWIDIEFDGQRASIENSATRLILRSADKATLLVFATRNYDEAAPDLRISRGARYIRDVSIARWVTRHLPDISTMLRDGHIPMLWEGLVADRSPID